MGTFSRLRYVIAANVNSLLEKAEDPEKLLRALIREMEDASEDARVASAELMAEEQRLVRLESRLAEDVAKWNRRAENAVSQGRDDLARGALKARNELSEQHKSAIDEQALIRERVKQMEQDMVTLKSKLAEAKLRLKNMQSAATPAGAKAAAREPSQRLTPGERRMKRAMGRFERLQTQVDNLEARVRSYEMVSPVNQDWELNQQASDPEIEDELEQLKQRISAPAQEVAVKEAEGDQATA